MEEPSIESPEPPTFPVKGKTPLIIAIILVVIILTIPFLVVNSPEPDSCDIQDNMSETFYAFLSYSEMGEEESAFNLTVYRYLPNGTMKWETDVWPAKQSRQIEIEEMEFTPLEDLEPSDKSLISGYIQVFGTMMDANITNATEITYYGTLMSNEESRPIFSKLICLQIDGKWHLFFPLYI